MKEKSAEQLCLDIPGYMQDQDKGTVFQLFLHSIYTGITKIQKLSLFGNTAKLLPF
jgi:hypothetical protein